MRLFVAVRPPAQAVAHAATAVDAVRQASSDTGVRWVPAERWHLTLAFYGEVPDADLVKVNTRLDRRLRDAADCTLALDGAGYFRRRALWLGVTGDVPGVRRLARAVAREPRPYRPHLTVARLRGDADARPAVAALSSYAGPPWAASSVHLVRSRLGPSPTYDDLASWSLATA